MRHKFSLFFWMILTILLMASIFLLSSQDADSSKELSNDLLSRIKAFIDLLPNIFNVEDGKKIRKYAHLFEYMCLGASSFMFFKELFLTKKRRICFAFCSAAIFGLLYACSDEIHQIFVPGRACQLRDIIIDFAGIVLSAGIFGIFSTLFYKKQEHKNE